MTTVMKLTLALHVDVIRQLFNYYLYWVLLR